MKHNNSKTTDAGVQVSGSRKASLQQLNPSFNLAHQIHAFQTSAQCLCGQVACLVYEAFESMLTTSHNSKYDIFTYTMLNAARFARFSVNPLSTH